MARKAYIFILLLVSVQLAMAQIEFKTTVSKNKLGVNQRLRVEFSVNKQGADNFKPPGFKNFKVVAGPTHSVNQSWINGKVSYTQSYIYSIQPLREGTFSIQPATIEFNDEVVSSNAVRITVLSEIELPKDPNDPYYIAQENIHLVAEVSKLNPYLGEGIYVVYKLFFSENIGINDWRVSESPEYNGFWNQDIEVKEIKVRNSKYNGENYRYIILKKAVLIPQRPGNLIIEPIKMDFTIGVPTGRGDFFGNMITRNINYSTASPKRVVHVKNLPTEGKPIDFSGAVGDFNFEVSASKSTLKANESSQIKVEVSGSGNLKLFELPKITTPVELEVYTPEHKENVSTTLNGLRGKIVDYYTVVPQYKGKYKIPEVAFSFFDPKEGKYKTILNEAVFVEVTEGKPIPGEGQTTILKKNVVLTDNNFRYIATSTSFQPVEKDDFFLSNWFYILTIVPFLIIPIGVFVGRKKAERARDIIGNRKRRADKLARKFLSEAKKQLGHKEAFYIAMERALHNFLKAKLLIETSDISKEKITELLRDKGVDIAIIKELQSVLDDCDFARFTPSTDVMMQQEYQKAKEVITKIDRQL